MNWINLLLSSKGRIKRKTFLVGLVPILILMALLYAYLAFVSSLLPGWANMLIAGFIAIESLYFLSNLSIKRMHDYDRSAHFLWFLFAPLIIAGIFIVQQKYYPFQTHEVSVLLYIVFITLAMISFLWMLTELIFRRSREDENAYGPPPEASK